MIVRWMAVGFAVWIAILLAFRFVGEWALHLATVAGLGLLAPGSNRHGAS